MKVSKSNIENFLTGILKDKARVITKVIFWKILHHSGKEDISLKIGRYNKRQKGIYEIEEPESESPKSELTLDNEEFKKLIDFINEHYEPFRLGERRYIPLDKSFDSSDIEHLKAAFRGRDKAKIAAFVMRNNILPEYLVSVGEHNRRIRAAREFEQRLRGDLLEFDWQTWLKRNDWILGTEFVRVLDERHIDTKHIADYLMQAYDGFLDIVEIKRPEGSMKFWEDKKDHDNYVPSRVLVVAITQASKYILEVEREANSVKFLQRVGNVPTIKPRCTLIFGRSHDWDEERREAYRILNSGYHNLTVLSYDHVLERAKRILGLGRERVKKDLETSP